MAFAISKEGFFCKSEYKKGATSILGAETYTNNQIAMSSIGIGEFIIRSILEILIRTYYETYNYIYLATRHTLQDMNNLVQGKVVVILLTNTRNH